MKNNLYDKQKNLAKELARKLRKNPTKAEKIFWEALRNRRFLNKKFYRQKIIFFNYYGKNRFFIVDFYCHEDKLVVELDGGIHKQQGEYDEIRTEYINTTNNRVIRFKNDDVENNLGNVLEKLEYEITHPQPLSCKERGLLPFSLKEMGPGDEVLEKYYEEQPI